MRQHATIRRQPMRPVYQPRNTGSGFCLQYAGVAGVAAMVIMPLFLSLGTGLAGVFGTIQMSIQA